jgi:RND superfamily putative drug exporter
MFAAIGKFVYRRRWLVLAGGIIFITLSIVYGTTLFGQLKGGGFEDPASESSKAAEALHRDLNKEDASLVVLFTSKDGSLVESSSYRQAVETTLANINGKEGVKSITSFYNTGAPQLVSNDKTSTYAVVSLAGDDEEQEKHAINLRPLITSDILLVRVGGQAWVFEQISEQVSKDLETAEMMTFPILAILLVFIFGSLIAAALPLAIGGIAILGAFLILRVLANFTDVSIFAINIITMLGLGLAIDYSLFVVSRFREELKRHNGDVPAALSRTMQTAGRTVLFSGLTVAISLLSLLVFPMMFLRSMGLGGAAAVLVAVVASLTVLPAVLALLGNRVNSLNVWSLIRRNKRPENIENAQTGMWYRISTFVMKRPTIVLVVSLIPLIIMGLPFLRVELTTADARSLPTGAESRVVSEVLERDFPRNETAPIQLVVRSQEPVLSQAGISTLYDYTRQLVQLPGVRRVDSLVTLDPSLDKAAYSGFYSDASLAQNPQAQAAAAQYANGNFTLVSVLYDTHPLSDESQQLVRDIRALSVPSGLSVQVSGASAYQVDFLVSLGKSIPYALVIILVTIFVLLFLMLGSVVIPVKAVVLNVLSLSVSFGALVWVFQDGNLSNLLGFTPLGSIDGTQPILIFAIAFGLSMDYEVFLLSRVKEHYDRTGNNTASVALGVQKTGGIITSAAILLVVVIGGFATGQILFIKQIGVGLALAILVDATIVRVLLVPATMRLLGKYNWWAPAPLTALYKRMGMSEVEQEEESEKMEPVLVEMDRKAS